MRKCRTKKRTLPQGIEMTPVDDSRNAYTVTTDKFAAGDSFGFAVVEAGCTIEVGWCKS